MKHGFWTSERKKMLKKLVIQGYSNREIKEFLDIPIDASESYLDASIRRYAHDEKDIRKILRKSKSKTRLKPLPKTKSIKRKRGEEEEIKIKNLRTIPEKMHLTELEMLQALFSAPLPPFHPLAGTIFRINKFKSLNEDGVI